jgi:hypothetical protein
VIGCLVVGVQARLRQHGHSLRFVAWCQRSRVNSGLGKHRAALDDRSDDQRLDLGCAPADGAFEYTRHDGASKLESCTTDRALLFFLMRLFHLLQRTGTAAAMDIDRWGEAAFG